MRRSLLILAAMAALGLAGCKRQNTFAAPPPPKVTVATPVAKKITRYLEATGNAAAVNSVDLVARVQGFLQEISYTDGAAVKAGDVLFTIEPLPYQTKLQQAQAAEVGARAQLVDAEAGYNRQLALQKNAVASVQALDDARAQRDSAQASLAQAQANTQLAAITSYTRIAAPFDGIVSAHLVSVGELVGTSPTPLATIVRIQPIHVNFNLSEQDVQRIRIEMARQGVQRDDLSKFRSRSGCRSRPAIRTRATSTTPPRPSTLRPARLRSRRARQHGPCVAAGVFRPRPRPDRTGRRCPSGAGTALGRGPGRALSLVVAADDVIAQRHVSTGPLDGTMRVIEQGVTPTDRVVVAGLQRAVPERRWPRPGRHDDRQVLHRTAGAGQCAGHSVRPDRRHCTVRFAGRPIS